MCSALLFWYTLYTRKTLPQTLYTRSTQPQFELANAHTHRLLESNLSTIIINDTLADLHHFEYVMNNVSICTSSQKEGSDSIVIMVHTARSNFEQRYAIRNTWGSLKLFKQWHLHLVFLLGIDLQSSQELNTQLLNESKQHGDLIMGNFKDSYRNLTYKHLMGYKWVSKFCPQATFILKTDDDIFADIFQVLEVIQAELMSSNRTYACLNMGGNKPIRDKRSKWFVSKELYPDEMYPDFCSGSSYLMRATDAVKIYSASNRTQFFWIDDVFVTGILRSQYDRLVNGHNSTSLQIFNLHSRHHLQDKSEIVNWCSKGLETSQLNFTFILLNKEDFVREMFCIWNKLRLTRYVMNTITGEAN